MKHKHRERAVPAKHHRKVPKSGEGKKAEQIAGDGTNERLLSQMHAERGRVNRSQGTWPYLGAIDREVVP